MVELARRKAALLKEHGRLIVQPWVNRTLDFGMGLDPGEDGDGRWLEIPARELVPGDVVKVQIGILVRDHLEVAGYLGPFGIDGWEYESITGARMLMPLGEINARRRCMHGWSALRPSARTHLRPRPPYGPVPLEALLLEGLQLHCDDRMLSNVASRFVVRPAWTRARIAWGT